MNYAFHRDLGDMACETWCEIHTKLNVSEKRAGWYGPEHIGQSGPNSVIMMAQVDKEEKSTTPVKLVKEMAAKMGKYHEVYKLTPDGR